jgi:hypothetical protein
VILKELAAELIGMFFAEKRLTLATLTLVAVTGWLVDVADWLLCGAILLFGSLILLIASVFYAARPRVF